jgi:hypothetical protein
VYTRTGLFSVPSSNRAPAIYLVLELEKSLHGDYETAIEPYVKFPVWMLAVIIAIAIAILTIERHVDVDLDQGEGQGKASWQSQR